MDEYERRHPYEDEHDEGRGGGDPDEKHDGDDGNKHVNLNDHQEETWKSH